MTSYDVISTLIKIISGIYQKDSGEVLYKGKSINNVLDMPISEALDFFEEISKTYIIKNVLSYQEIGNNLSYSRDKKISQFFRKGASRFPNLDMLHQNGESRCLKCVTGGS